MDPASLKYGVSHSFSFFSLILSYFQPDGIFCLFSFLEQYLTHLNFAHKKVLIQCVDFACSLFQRHAKDLFDSVKLEFQGAGDLNKCSLFSDFASSFNLLFKSSLHSDVRNSNFYS